MSESHTISAWRRKRAELSGELIKLEKQRQAVAYRIRSVDDALKLFGFDGDPNDFEIEATGFSIPEIDQLVEGLRPEEPNDPASTFNTIITTIRQILMSPHAGVADISRLCSQDSLHRLPLGEFVY